MGSRFEENRAPWPKSTRRASAVPSNQAIRPCLMLSTPARNAGTVSNCWYGDLIRAGRRSVASAANAFRSRRGDRKGRRTRPWRRPAFTLFRSKQQLFQWSKCLRMVKFRFIAVVASPRMTQEIRVQFEPMPPNVGRILRGLFRRLARRCVARRNRHNGGFPSPILAALSLREGGAPRSKRPIE